MNIKKYERKEQVIDPDLWADDRLTFSVLSKIVNQKATFVITDQKRFVLCYSAFPYPVWLWTTEDITEEEQEEIWQLCKKEQILPGQVWTGSEQNGMDSDPEKQTEMTENRPISGINMKYEMAEYFIRRAKEEGYLLEISLHMLVYDCPASVLPKKEAEGCITPLKEADLEEAADFLYQFKQETGVDREERENCLEKMKARIKEPGFFLWKNAAGKNVAMCAYSIDGELGKIGPVYCRPEERRKGYAENLVYQVTMEVQKMGLLPVLYTNAEYEASNRCYQKIGYQRRGRLCTLGAAQSVI